MRVIEMCKISPCPSSAAAAAAEKFSLSLTLFDVMHFTCPPIKRILFYSLPLHDPQLVSTTLLNLKQSLSVALSHFLPFAGNLVWPEDSPEPFILYTPGDSVSLTVCEADADFNHLSANHVRKANESHFLIPDLHSSDSAVAPIMSIQITLFPNCGLSICITISHKVADGKTATLFLKSWASICRNNDSNLPPDLIPNFNRSTKFKNENQLYQKLFNAFVSKNPKRLNFPTKELMADDIVSGTFEVTRADMEKLRRKAGPCRHFLTNFMITYSYITTCLAKAQPIDQANSKTGLLFLVDWRGRMGNDVGGARLNYFGNGVFGCGFCLQDGKFEEEHVMGLISNKIKDKICEIDMSIKEGKFMEMIEENLGGWIKEMPISRTIVVGGSPKFGLYDIDFGWGRCHKVELVSSFSTTAQYFPMVDSRNGDGGVEVGVVLPSKTMNTFCSLFYEGLKNHVD